MIFRKVLRTWRAKEARKSFDMHMVRAYEALSGGSQIAVVCREYQNQGGKNLMGEEMEEACNFSRFTGGGGN